MPGELAGLEGVDLLDNLGTLDSLGAIDNFGALDNLGARAAVRKEEGRRPQGGESKECGTAIDRLHRQEILSVVVKPLLAL